MTNVTNLPDQQLSTIIDLLHANNGSRELPLAEPITVRLTPHTYPLEIYGLCVSPKKELIIKTIDVIGTHPEGFWNPLSIKDKHADKMIASIYQRVTSIYKTAAVV